MRNDNEVAMFDYLTLKCDVLNWCLSDVVGQIVPIKKSSLDPDQLEDDIGILTEVSDMANKLYYPHSVCIMIVNANLKSRCIKL